MNKLISKYILRTVLPYFVFSWLLLVVILFVQQASRYSDIFFSTNIPSGLVWQLTAALAPNVIAFTCPMAVLVGTVIGFSKMQGDNELIALRAAGVANFKLLLPVFLLGITLSAFAFFVNLKAVPFAAKVVRSVAVQTAIFKLESPIEPGVFNTEINGYTIYVRNGDIEKGVWKNIFIYSEDEPNNVVRLITSKSGRIDYYNDSSELVLNDAVATTFPANRQTGKYVSENLGQFRWVIKTKRSELIDKLSNSEQIPDELGLVELAKYAETLDGKEKIEAQILFYRKIILSVTPLLFALLGAALILRFNRSGRGFGVLLALISLVVYYLTVLLGEQLARTGKITPFNAGLLPLVSGIIVVIWLPLSKRRSVGGAFGRTKKFNVFDKIKFSQSKSSTSLINTRILDFDIIGSLLKYLGLTFGFLSALFLIFTSFELWKFAGVIDHGGILLLKYLLYLLPYIYLQLASASLMIAVLATYIIKSRQNEIITWTAAGQSVFRLLVPCFLLMLVLGILNRELQENILPQTNQMQDALRARIRSQGLMTDRKGKYWMASESRIYSFDPPENADDSNQKVKNLTVYVFSADKLMLTTIYRSSEAVWSAEKIRLADDSEKLDFRSGEAAPEKSFDTEIVEASNPFIVHDKKPAQLNSQQIKDEINTAEGEIERRNYEIALQKRRTTIFLPLIITLFTAPFALSLSRKGKAVTVGYAVGIWLLFMGVTNIFEQFGLNGSLPPAAAVWSPLVLFTMLGFYLLSKIRT